MMLAVVGLAVQVHREVDLRAAAVMVDDLDRGALVVAERADEGVLARIGGPESGPTVIAAGLQVSIQVRRTSPEPAVFSSATASSGGAPQANVSRSIDDIQKGVFGVPSLRDRHPEARASS